jgi:DNA polymerase III alpha subunit
MIPLFKSHYSIGKSILTLEKAGQSAEDGPDSIIDIAKEHKLHNVVLVEDSISGLVEAYQNFKSEKINLIFGVRMTCTEDMAVKTQESLGKNHKIIIFCKNKNGKGVEKLIRLWTAAATTGRYYEPRIDFQTIHSIWDDSDLLMGIPFYDSFIYNNGFTFNVCVPDFRKIKPIFFVERNDLPFDALLNEKVKKYASDNGYETQRAQSVFYKSKKDFPAYLTFRCINNRSSFEKPELDHMCSDSFSFESYLLNVSK